VEGQQGMLLEYTFLWDGGNLQTIQYPGAQHTSVPGINASGLLFGNWGNDTEHTAGFYDPKRDVWRPLPPIPNKPLNFGVRATDSGVALGYACEGTWFQSENCIMWLWTRGAYEFLSISADVGIPTHINNRGQIVGHTLNPPDFTIFTGFLYDRSGFSLLFPPGINSLEVIPRAISNSGAILMHGETDPEIYWQPFISERGRVTFLPEYASGGQTTYLGMNERGDLAGLFATGFPEYQAIVAYRRK
jgi:hypothetical protein